MPLEFFRPSIRFNAKTAASILAVGVVVALIGGAAAGNQELVKVGTMMLIAVVVLAITVFLSWVFYSYFRHR